MEKRFSDMLSIGDIVSKKKKSGCLVEINIFFRFFENGMFYGFDGSNDLEK
jgi:hypothetical protein